jgi:hypothetical protein
MSTENQGKIYFGIMVPKTLSATGKIFAFADEISVENGALMLKKQGEKAGGSVASLIVPSGQWLAVYAANKADGSALSIERWHEATGASIQFGGSVSTSARAF